MLAVICDHSYAIPNRTPVQKKFQDVSRMSASAATVLAAIQSGPPLERNTLGDQVYAHIRQLLIAGRLAPGDKLSLRQLADVMGVSMMPVREAVSRLVADQAIEVTPNRALRVPIMSRRQFEELAVIRAEIEGFAAERAAAVRTPAQLDAVMAAERRFAGLAREARPDLSQAVAANQAFHFAVYEASGLADLVGVIGGLWLKVGPVINLDLRENPERLATGSAAALHANCAAAIAAGDGKAARAALAADIGGAAAFIVSRGRLPD
jgi:DNA-binding GntR family transcriptional regulator